MEARSSHGSGQRDLHIYGSRPPAWLPELHRSADLGYIGFYPPHPRQEEDILTETNVKKGFDAANPVSAETFSAHGVINENIDAAHESLSKLEQLVSAVLKRRTEQVPPVPVSTFRLPSRVTLNDAKRQSWFSDLANPTVPLYKLSKSVPHGAKGHHLLDLLHSHNVEIPRAIWFLRVFGANETTGLRNKTSYNPTQYSIDWANVVTGYIKKQLNEIVLPMVPRPGLNIKQTFKGVLSESDLRERWVSRYSYCMKLVGPFYSEGLIDHCTFLSWLVQTFLSCNLAQAVFVTELVDEYIDGIMNCRAFVQPVVSGSLTRLAEIQGCFGAEYLRRTDELLKTILQCICLSIPDAFVSPRLWTSHYSLIHQIFSEEGVIKAHVADVVVQSTRTIQTSLQENLLEIQHRNEAMLFQNLPSFGLARLGSQVMHVQMLNSISDKTSLSSVPFWEKAGEESPPLPSKIDMLLTWSVSPLQYGDHRPLAAATLLRIWRKGAGERATRRDTISPDDFLQDQLFEWLDVSDVAADPSNLSSVAMLFGRLVEYELFSYPKYVQRLIARAEFSTSNEGENSRHISFLRWIPLHHSTPALVNQRKMILYSPRTRESPDDLLERDMRHEIRTLLPDLFDGQAIVTSHSLSIHSSVLSAPRYAQMKIFRDWLVPHVRNHTLIFKQHGQGLMSVSSYCLCVELMAQAKNFQPVLDVALMLLEVASSTDYLTAVLTTLDNHKAIFNCMEQTQRICMALLSAHQSWRAKGIQFRALLSLLVDLDDGRFLDQENRSNIGTDICHLKMTLQPHVDNYEPVPDILPEILLLARDLLPDAPSILANSLWFKYRGALDWAWKVWDNTIASLRQIPAMTEDITTRNTCALRYATFLLHVDQHLSAGFDDQVLKWFLGPGKNEALALSAEAWDAVIFVLVFLCSHGALRITTILQGLIYPIWTAASAIASKEAEGVETALHSVNNLFQTLMLQKQWATYTLLTISLLEAQFLESRRKDVFRQPHFSHLMKCIPFMIFLEKNSVLPDSLRKQSARIREELCRQPDFRCGAYANLDAVREAFEQQWGKIDGHLREGMINALDIVLSSTVSSSLQPRWRDISCLLSPWKLAATAIKLQFTFNQMGTALSDPTLKVGANASINELASMIFHHSLTSEEAYFVAEMAASVGSIVAGKFVNTGLQCIGELLCQTCEVTEFARFVQRTGEFLRILSRITQPLRDGSAALPVLEAHVQDGFFIALCNRLDVVWALLTSCLEQQNNQEPAISSMVMFLMRLLQFDLGFPGVWSPKTKENYERMRSALLQICFFYAAGRHLDFIKFPLVLDTLCFFIDDFPLDTRTPAFDPFRSYPKQGLDMIPEDLPPEHDRKLRYVLNYLPPLPCVENLIIAQEDMDGNLLLGSSIQNRPWEWVEYLGDPTLDAKEEEKEREEKRRLKTRYLIKNSASIPLELFGARMTGDGVLNDTHDSRNHRFIETARTFEDSLSVGVIEQGWRDSKLLGVDTSDTTNQPSSREGTSDAPSPHGRRDSAPRSLPGSPLPISPSHHITSASGHSSEHTPQQGSYRGPTSLSGSINAETTSNSTVASSRRISKRKANASVSSDLADTPKKGRVASKTAKKR